MRRARRRAAKPDGAARSAESMAGWLFADLLLVLFIVGLGTEIIRAEEPEMPEDPPAIEEPGPPVMRQDPVVFDLSVNASALLSKDPTQRQQVKDQIAAQSAGFSDSKAVLILIFGHAADPGRGGAISDEVAGIVKEMGAPYSAETVTRAFWKGGSEGLVRLEVFVLDNPPTEE